MKKMWLYFLCVALILLITAVFVAFADDSDRTNREFLAVYGWSVSRESIEREELAIPSDPDSVWEGYELIQKEAGLSLAPFFGKKAVRTTYIVYNYPADTDLEIRANVLAVSGTPVGGDIMSVSAENGFMHSLLYPTAQEGARD